MVPLQVPGAEGAAELSREARKRLQWFDHYRAHGARWVVRITSGRRRFLLCDFVRPVAPLRVGRYRSKCLALPEFFLKGDGHARLYILNQYAVFFAQLELGYRL